MSKLLYLRNRKGIYRKGVPDIKDITDFIGKRIGESTTLITSVNMHNSKDGTWHTEYTVGSIDTSYPFIACELYGEVDLEKWHHWMAASKWDMYEAIN